MNPTEGRLQHQIRMVSVDELEHLIRLQSSNGSSDNAVVVSAGIDGVELTPAELERLRVYAEKSDRRERIKPIRNGYQRAPGRNALCPCGKPKKYKKCCGSKI